MVPNLENHKYKTTIDASTIQCKKTGQTLTASDQSLDHLRSSRVKCIFIHSFIFSVFFEFFNFSLFHPLWVFSHVFLQISRSLFPSIPNYFEVFFSGFRCGNSVDFLYGGLIVRVSSCLSAFRSFALHTFFKSRDSI